MGRTRTSFPVFRRLFALSALVLAAALPLHAWAVDTDGDGVDDSIDAFPNNAEASTDTDHDGKPDSINWALAPTLGAFTLTSPYSYVSTGNIFYQWSWFETAGKVGANINLPNGTATAELKVSVYVPAGGGNVSFDYRGITMGYSLLDNGQSILAGVGDTQNFNASLAAGFHQLDWKVTASGCSGCGSRGFLLSNLVVQNVKVVRLSEDSDDDNDGVADTADIFPLNAAASADVDNDGLPDRWNSNYGCATNAATCNGLTLDADADPDADGVLNALDNCVVTANPDQIDADSDGLGDACDASPNGPLAQTIAVTKSAPASAVYGASFQVAATASSGLPVSIAASGGCSISGSTVTMTSGTTACALVFSQAGNENYYAASSINSTTLASKANQSITVTTMVPRVLVYGSSFVASASVSSGLPVVVGVSGGCELNGNTVTMISSIDSCSVQFSQPGDANYHAAQPAYFSASANSDLPFDGTYKGSAVREQTGKQ